MDLKNLHIWKNTNKFSWCVDTFIFLSLHLLMILKLETIPQLSQSFMTHSKLINWCVAKQHGKFALVICWCETFISSSLSKSKIMESSSFLSWCSTDPLSSCNRIPIQSLDWHSIVYVKAESKVKESWSFNQYGGSNHQGIRPSSATKLRNDDGSNCPHFDSHAQHCHQELARKLAIRSSLSRCTLHHNWRIGGLPAFSSWCCEFLR